MGQGSCSTCRVGKVKDESLGHPSIYICFIHQCKIVSQYHAPRSSWSKMHQPPRERRRPSSPHNALQAQLLEQYWQVFLLDLNHAMIKCVNLDPCLCLLSHFLKRKPKPIPAITTFLHLRMQLLIF